MRQEEKEGGTVVAQKQRRGNRLARKIGMQKKESSTEVKQKYKGEDRITAELENR